ncbi:hypothetical protein BV898_06248 [Hypsibius exemplaris]|uniref:Uncharacterized protein n=1 Tax=Hypsibius exemplaris TaxID=2072580 RepID=A0A1W0WWX9_HYPEX|nr:hypothetical protein BV898_06248 [Hypsibius exemplaris]
MNRGDRDKRPPERDILRFNRVRRCSEEKGFEASAEVIAEQIGTETNKQNLETARNLSGITGVYELNFFGTPLDTDGFLNADYDQRLAYPTPTKSTSVVVPTNLVRQVATEKRETHLRTAKNLPGITGVTAMSEECII